MIAQRRQKKFSVHAAAPPHPRRPQAFDPVAL
jgi:hypothetical protein